PLRTVTLFPYTTLFRSRGHLVGTQAFRRELAGQWPFLLSPASRSSLRRAGEGSALTEARDHVASAARLVALTKVYGNETLFNRADRKSTRLNSSHVKIS